MWICEFREQISFKDGFRFASLAFQTSNKPQGVNFNAQVKKESWFAFTKHGHMEWTQPNQPFGLH